VDRAAQQRDAADEGRLEASGSIIVGQVIMDQGEVVRPSQLIASVGRTIVMRSLVTMIIAVMTCGCAGRSEKIALDHSGQPGVTGTFSNLHVDSRGVFGAEVRIAVTQEPAYQAVVQFGGAEFCAAQDHGNEPCFRVSNLILAEAEFDWRKSRGNDSYLTFRTPTSSGYDAVFEGWVSKSSLSGKFTFRGGRVLEVVLKRGRSYWDGEGTT
jgi:hypothetical protein